MLVTHTYRNRFVFLSSILWLVSHGAGLGARLFLILCYLLNVTVSSCTAHFRNPYKRLEDVLEDISSSWASTTTALWRRDRFSMRGVTLIAWAVVAIGIIYLLSKDAESATAVEDQISGNCLISDFSETTQTSPTPQPPRVWLHLNRWSEGADSFPRPIGGGYFQHVLEPSDDQKPCSKEAVNGNW